MRGLEGAGFDPAQRANEQTEASRSRVVVQVSSRVLHYYCSA